MLAVRIIFENGYDNILECVEVKAVPSTLVRSPEDAENDKPWTPQRTIICIMDDGFERWFSEGWTSIYVMNDKGRTIATYSVT